MSRFEPKATPDTQPYWDGCARGELVIQRCRACDRPYFYPRAFCPACLGDDVVWFRASGRATLHSYVISHLRAPGFEPPYVIAVVELEEGPRMMSNVVGVDPQPENLSVGMPLVVDFEPVGSMAVPVFRPLAGAGQGL